MVQVHRNSGLEKSKSKNFRKLTDSKKIALKELKEDNNLQEFSLKSASKKSNEIMDLLEVNLSPGPKLNRTSVQNTNLSKTFNWSAVSTERRSNKSKSRLGETRRFKMRRSKGSSLDDVLK